MILVDTSVWIDHLRAADLALIDLLERTEAVAHQALDRDKPLPMAARSFGVAFD